MITSKNIKDIVKNNPNQVFTIDPQYNGTEITCTYKDSDHSITTFIDTNSNEQIHILRGQMKFVHLK